MGTGKGLYLSHTQLHLTVVLQLLYGVWSTTGVALSCRREPRHVTLTPIIIMIMARWRSNSAPILQGSRGRPAGTDRESVLNELLSSERIYARSLAAIRDIF